MRIDIFLFKWLVGGVGNFKNFLDDIVSCLGSLVDDNIY